jgi:hypothetical protein
MPRYRKKPLAQLEHGTRIYAPPPARPATGWPPPTPSRESGSSSSAAPKTRPARRRVSSKGSSPKPRPSAIHTTPVHAPWSDWPTNTSMTTCQACRCGSGRSRPTCCAAGCSPRLGARFRHRLDPRRLRGGDRRRPLRRWLRRARPRHRRNNARPRDTRPAAAVADRPERGPHVDGPLRQDRHHPRRDLRLSAPLIVADRRTVRRPLRRHAGSRAPPLGHRHAPLPPRRAALGRTRRPTSARHRVSARPHCLGVMTHPDSGTGHVAEPLVLTPIPAREHDHWSWCSRARVFHSHVRRL